MNKLRKEIQNKKLAHLASVKRGEYKTKCLGLSVIFAIIGCVVVVLARWLGVL